jgi:outer membrane protein
VVAAASLLLPGAGEAAQRDTAVVTPPVPAPSPGPDPSRPISLQEAVQVGLQHHARIAVAEESVEAARQRVRQARVGTLPTVNAQVGYSGRGTSSLGGLFGGEPTRTTGTPPTRQVIDTDVTTFDQGLQPRFALNFNPYDGGLTRTQVRQARTGVESAAANLIATQNNQSLTVATNYFLQLRAERLLELRVEQVRLASEQLARVEATIRAGRAAEADRALILSEYRNRQVDQIVAANDRRIAANALRNSMGLPVGPPLTLVELREDTDALPVLEALRDQARRRRPEVIQAEAAVRIAELGVSIARIGRLPRLSTTFAFDVSPNQPLQRGQFAVGAVVSMPLWDAGLTHAREQEARTDVQASAANLEQTRRDVAAEVDQAYLDLVAARERLEAARLAVEAAQVNLEQATARYELGTADVLDLITAQVQFANANNAAISALYDVHLARAQLDRAVGR